MVEGEGLRLGGVRGEEGGGEGADEVVVKKNYFPTMGSWGLQRKSIQSSL